MDNEKEIVEKCKKALTEKDSRTFNKEFDKIVPRSNDGTISLGDILDKMFETKILEK